MLCLENFLQRLLEIFEEVGSGGAHVGVHESGGQAVRAKNGCLAEVWQLLLLALILELRAQAELQELELLLPEVEELEQTARKTLSVVAANQRQPAHRLELLVLPALEQ